MTKRISRHKNHYRLITFALVPMLVSTTTHADEPWLPGSFQIHGFLSQSIISTTENNFFGDSEDDLSLEFRELGINASWQPIPSFRMALQAVSRDAGKTDDGNIRIDYGLADYSLISTETTLLGLRVGRVLTPLGLYNETRDVAATRPSILLPQSIYFDVNRNLSLSADGGYVYGEYRTNYGDFLLETGLIYPRTDDPDFKQVIVGDAPGEMDGELSWIGRLSYEWGLGRLRLAATYADLNADFDPDDIPGNRPPGSFTFKPLILSFQYNAEKWSLTGEYAWRRTQLTNFGIPDFDSIDLTDFTGESYYLQGTYRLRRDVEALIRYDELIWDRSDPDGQAFEAEKLGPNHSRFAKDWTFGLRWHITPSLMLSAEYHRVNGTGWLSMLENRDGTSQRWNLYALMLSYNF